MSQEPEFKKGDTVGCHHGNTRRAHRFDGSREVERADTAPYSDDEIWYKLKDHNFMMRENELFLYHVLPPVEKEEEEQAEDPAINPGHYKDGKYELIDVMFDKMGTQAVNDFMWGSIIKYIFRFKKKNGLQDLLKAQWYLNKLIKTTKEEEANVGKEG
jgi:hypothetical protein